MCRAVRAIALASVELWLRRCTGDVVAGASGAVVAPVALAVWLRGLRCVSVLVAGSGIKGAFGVAFGDRTSSTLDTRHVDQGRTQLRGSRAEVGAASMAPPARVIPGLMCEPVPVVPPGEGALGVELCVPPFPANPPGRGLSPQIVGWRAVSTLTTHSFRGYPPKLWVRGRAWELSTTGISGPMVACWGYRPNSGVWAGPIRWLFRLVVRPDHQVVHRWVLGVAGVANDRR